MKVVVLRVRVLGYCTLVLLLASPAGAATLALTSGTLSLRFGPLPPITLPANAGVTVSVSDATGDFVLPASAFGPATVTLPASLFTGIPSISGYRVSGLANPALAVVGGAASGGVRGTAFVNVLQFVDIPFKLAVAGRTLSVTNRDISPFNFCENVVCDLHAQAAWTAGAAVVTGIITTTPGTAVLNTISIAGSDSRTIDHGGSLTLVAGFQVISAGFVWPGFVSTEMHWSVVPEPATGLLLGLGSVVLALLGRRRMR